ncbi:MAG: leucyl aminopeptidase [Candidatus Berkiella sp.]
MEYQIKSGQPEKQRHACIVVGIYDSRKMSRSAESLDAASNGYISAIVRRGDIEGKFNQSLILHNVPGLLSDRILLIGCGKERDIDEIQYRKIIRKATECLNDIGAMEAASYLTELPIKGRNLAWKVQEAVISSEQTLYRFDQLKSQKETDRRPLRKLILMANNRSELTQGEIALEKGIAISAGMSLTKDLGNMPANICTPEYLAKQAQTLAKSFSAMSCKILEEENMKELGMGALLSVTAGSQSKAKLIQLEYKGGDKKKKPIVLVGKGITFDTGGNSLKPPAGMIGMKFDMCGGATVLGVLKAAALLKLPLNIVGIVPACENMPGATATRPDDIVTSMSGKTIEILNTDAEGRLILADALTYAERFEPDAVIDIATLTGACVVALGYEASGLMSNHNPLANELLNASQVAFDRTWQLPLWDSYHDVLKSNFADMANVGNMSAPAAGTIVAGCFLSKFTKKYHWAHLDIAGVACQWSGDKKGASGRPVPLLVQFLLNRSE